MREKLSLFDALKNNKLLTFILFVAEMPCFFISLHISTIFNFNAQNDWEFAPLICVSVVDFMIHFILYITFRFAMKKKIHALVIIAQLAIFTIIIPFMVSEFFNSSIILGTMAIRIGSCILFQALLFSAFSTIVSLLDRHTKLKEWLKILISFISAIPVGLLASWLVWMSLMELYILFAGAFLSAIY